MNTSINLELDQRYQKKDGTYPIKLLLVVNRDPIRIPTGYSVEAKYWQSRNQSIKSSCKAFPNVTRVNTLLQRKKAEATDILLCLEDEGQLHRLSLKEIKGQIQGKKTAVFILDFCQQIIDELEQAGKVGNARVYRMLWLSLRRYAGERDFPLLHVTYTWLKKYEAWYLSLAKSNGKSNTVNGLSVQMRTLRALYNRAIKRGLLSADTYPFKQYTIKREATRKRAITPEDIARLRAVEPKSSRQQEAKTYFLMSFYLMGASFIDLAFLKVEDIRQGRVEYKRKKTGRLHSIKVPPPLQIILNPYLEDKEPDDFLLGIVPKDAPLKRQYTRARTVMQRYNRSLKELAELAGVEADITGYTARHTFASLAKHKGVPVAAISEALGHADLKTTQVYLSQFDQDTMDQFHDMIVGQ